MIEVHLKEQETPEYLVKRYKKKMDKLGLVKRLKDRYTVFIKHCERRKKEKNKAIRHQRYKQTHDLD